MFKQCACLRYSCVYTLTLAAGEGVSNLLQVCALHSAGIRAVMPHDARVIRPVRVQVLVATAPMAWGMTAAAQLVVIMGTQVRCLC